MCLCWQDHDRPSPKPSPDHFEAFLAFVFESFSRVHAYQVRQHAALEQHMAEMEHRREQQKQDRERQQSLIVPTGAKLA